MVDSLLENLVKGVEETESILVQGGQLSAPHSSQPTTELALYLIYDMQLL